MLLNGTNVTHSARAERLSERENGIKGNFYGNEEQTYGISIVCLFNTQNLFNGNCHFLFIRHV